ncbi:MAG: type II toxin-antitoxin system PemK/MazF family toxin [Acidobacteriota bacterium]|nr:type II toxin-antitoxin system PemK/MazF family toxin [Acidobacteriota bacterium]
MTSPLSRGDVVRVRLDPTEGRKIRKTRPAVVVSNRAACRYDSVIQVVPITALPERELRPYETSIGMEPSGLSKPSRAVANQIRTVARHRITERLGHVASFELDAIDRAISIQLGLRTTK